MSDRDRLIELVCDKIQDGHCIGYCYYPPCSQCKDLADHLLANGVIVPVRCKDCKHFIPDEMLDHTEYPNEIEADGICDNIDKYTDKDHFCWYGKLKEREG